ncbi:hypothetical protein GCM10027562_19260 [Arthrobacter pigmenti]
MQADRLRPGVLAEYADRAGVGLQQAEQHADGGGLSSTIGAKEAVDFAGFQRKVQIIKGTYGTE